MLDREQTLISVVQHCKAKTFTELQNEVNAAINILDSQTSSRMAIPLNSVCNQFKVWTRFLSLCLLPSTRTIGCLMILFVARCSCFGAIRTRLMQFSSYRLSLSLTLHSLRMTQCLIANLSENQSAQERGCGTRQVLCGQSQNGSYVHCQKGRVFHS